MSVEIKNDDLSCSRRLWLEEHLSDDMKISYLVKNVLYSGKSSFQEVELMDSVPYGKLLLLDGKIQSTERDEFMYHELLVHVAMLHHPNPKTVFIAGGGEGATAREVLRHKSVEKVVMVDIDKVVCDFCNEHLEANQAAFAHPKLELIHDDAKTQLENYPGTFDVIISDLADPLEGGPCYHLYTKDFYEQIVMQKLNPDGVFVAQSGPAGVLSCAEVFSPINNTFRSVFPRVLPYALHIPSFSDVWGWNLGLVNPEAKSLTGEEIDRLAAERVEGELRMLDADTYDNAIRLPKPVRQALAAEKEVFTLDNPKFIYGTGITKLV